MNRDFLFKIRVVERTILDIVVITGGAPTEGDESATPEVPQIAGSSITKSRVNGRTTYNLNLDYEV
jgi:hypothetical protein